MYQILFGVLQPPQAIVLDRIVSAPFNLLIVEESKESLLCGRETDRDLRSACKCAACFLFVFLRTSSVGGEGGGGVPDFFICSPFPYSPDHERDYWPSCQVIFSTWQPIR